jgi:hypothetical protein
MANIQKLVIYTSAEELVAHAGCYPCLVNYNPFNNTAVFDDGVGHTADVTFAVVTSKADIANLPPGPFDSVELIGFAVPTTLFAEE